LLQETKEVVKILIGNKNLSEIQTLALKLL
jgi:hypothetical protein